MLEAAEIFTSEVSNMTAIAQRITTMVDILPECEQLLAFEFLKRMVLAWDPDYVKSTPSEIGAMELGNAEIERGETVGHELVDWD